MERSSKIIEQVYGYAVCLVSVIAFLISFITLVNAVIDRGDPLHSGYTPGGSPSLASFENYKLDVLKSYQKSDNNNTGMYIPDDKELMSMYEAAKNDKIKTSEHQSNKSMLISSMMIVICFILFFTHWRWMRKMAGTPAERN